MSDPEDREISAARQPEDAAEASLRPQTLADFTGQKTSRENLAIFIQAAKSRGESLDHVLLHDPPGLGKTRSSPASSASGFAPHPALSSREPVIWPRS
jgi:Holliday junction resolvasome RuvABC ATP-dependent DNA helicase subunit